MARDAPSVAREQATWALLRPPAKLCLSRAALVRDACMALYLADASDHAIQAIRAGLDGLPEEGALGLYVELSLARYQIGREPEVKEELGDLTQRIEQRLSPDQRASFSARIRAYFEGDGSQADGSSSSGSSSH